MDNIGKLFGGQGNTSLGIPQVPALTAAQILSTLARGLPSAQGLTPMPGAANAPVGIPRPSSFTAPAAGAPTGLSGLVSGNNSLNQSLSGTLSGLYQSMLPPPNPPAPLGSGAVALPMALGSIPGAGGERGVGDRGATDTGAREGPGGQHTGEKGHEDTGQHDEEDGDPHGYGGSI